MGNHGSRGRRGSRKSDTKEGTAAQALSRIEEMRGGSVDSYDKLIAWLAQMAESDNVELDTSVFVSQLNRVCGARGLERDQYLGVSVPQGSSQWGGVSSSRRDQTIRQNSASCDSHVSHASSSDILSRQHRGSMRSEDLLDPRSAWRSGVSTRQNTFSSDLDPEEDPEVRNASMESLYSSTDRDSELGSVTTYDSAPSRRFVRNNFSNSSFNSGSPLLRTALNNRLTFKAGRTGVASPTLTPRSSSAGNIVDLANRAEETPPVYLSAPNGPSRKSVSLLNLDLPSHVQPTPSSPRKPSVTITRQLSDAQSNESDFSMPRKLSITLTKQLSNATTRSTGSDCSTPRRSPVSLTRQASNATTKSNGSDCTTSRKSPVSLPRQISNATTKSNSSDCSSSSLKPCVNLPRQMSDTTPRSNSSDYNPPRKPSTTVTRQLSNATTRSNGSDFSSTSLKPCVTLPRQMSDTTTKSYGLDFSTPRSQQSSNSAKFPARKRSSNLSAKGQKSRFERQMSLHTDADPSLGSGSPVNPSGGAQSVDIDEELTGAEAVAKMIGASNFLDDNLLDDHLADILFSVEALWPKK